ncbi:Ig-like domain-containing protein [Clostridium sp. VAP41]|uniref:Ig-like domain-containing protein n=1 Tax=Clostridium sp. VAP41 TaxID=2949979 RepID=UPI002079383A|nr:Ig-like domain-containing protein [Clostridium sp. VAP41]
MKNCFKKILIMFVMVLTVIGVGAFQNGITANAATDEAVLGIENLNNTSENSGNIGDKILNPEKGWKRYDDRNSKIQYNGDWSNRDTSSNKYASTDHCTMNVNDSATFAFYGSKLRILSQYASMNSDNIIISVDGVDTKVSTALGSQTDCVLLFEGTYSLENHIVKITNYGYWYNLDAIDIDDTGYLINLNESITLDKSSLSLKEGSSDKLTETTTPSAVDIDWSSSDETVATVDSNGNVKAIKEGQAKITVQIKGTDIKADCIVTVTKEDTEPKPTDPEQEYIINTAYAKGDNTNNASGEVSIIFKGVAEAQLKVVKTADVDSVYVGDNFTYTIEITNTSDKIAKSVVIRDNAPNHIQFIPSEVITTQGKIDSSSTSKNIIVNVGDIPPEGKVIIKIPVLVIE